MKVINLRADKRPAEEYEKKYNAPATDEIANLMVDIQHEHCELILQLRSRQLQPISETL